MIEGDIHRDPLKPGVELRFLRNSLMDLNARMNASWTMSFESSRLLTKPWANRVARR